MKVSWKQLLLAALVATAGLHGGAAQAGTKQVGKLPGFPISQKSLAPNTWHP